MAIDHKQQKIDDLYRLIADIHDPQQIRDLFDDLCTEREIEKMAERVYAAKLLLAGNTYSQIMEKADISSATLSRVSRGVQYGSGYTAMLK